jgi:hypothetical protein
VLRGQRRGDSSIVGIGIEERLEARSEGRQFRKRLERGGVFAKGGDGRASTVLSLSVGKARGER